MHGLIIVSIDYLIESDWLIEWLVDWLVGWLIDWLIDWLTDWLIDWLIDRPTDRPTDGRTDRPTVGWIFAYREKKDQQARAASVEATVLRCIRHHHYVHVLHELESNFIAKHRLVFDWFAGYKWSTWRQGRSWCHWLNCEFIRNV